MCPRRLEAGRVKLPQLTMGGLEPPIHREANIMSRAFVKETGESAPPPERMVDGGANPVTPEGFAQIEAHVARLEAALKTEANVLLREVRLRRAKRVSGSCGPAKATNAAS